MESVLSYLLTFLHLFSPACAAELPTAVCRHYFRPCSDNRSTVVWDPITSQECLSLTNYKCRVEVPAIKNFLTAIGTCLAMPDCHSMPEAESQSATSGINPKKLVIFCYILYTLIAYIHSDTAVKTMIHIYIRLRKQRKKSPLPKILGAHRLLGISNTPKISYFWRQLDCNLYSFFKL